MDFYYEFREKKRREEKREEPALRKTRLNTAKDKTDHQKKKDYWRKMKKEERLKWSAQKKRRHREACLERYHLKKAQRNEQKGTLFNKIVGFFFKPLYQTR